MSVRQTLILILLGLVLVFRIQQQGLSKYQPDPELEYFSSFFEDFRSQVSANLDQLLAEPQAGLLSGIVLGIKARLPISFKNSLRNTSTMHIVVVSGQNLTILSGFILSLASVFGRRKTLLIAVILCIFYSVLTGLQTPVIRAAIMVILSSSAQVFNRQSNSSWILALTVLVMLIYNPDWIGSISFQLSAVATFAVIVVAPEVSKRLVFIPKLLREDLAVSASAQLLTLPIIAASFHQISLIGILANSLVLWTVPLVMISGFVTIIGSLISQGVGLVLSIIPSVLLTYFVIIIDFLNQRWASVRIGSLNPLIWLGYYILILALLAWLKTKNKLESEAKF